MHEKKKTKINFTTWTTEKSGARRKKIEKWERFFLNAFAMSKAIDNKRTSEKNWNYLANMCFDVEPGTNVEFYSN